MDYQISKILYNRILQLRPSISFVVTHKALELQSEGRDIVFMTGESLLPPIPLDLTLSNRSETPSRKSYFAANEFSLCQSLIDLIVEKFSNDNHLTYHGDEIVVGSSAKELIFHTLLVSIIPGDEVLLPSPFWLSYPDMIKLAGGVPVYIPCRPECGFKLRPCDLEDAITANSRWLIIDSPNNPTGAVYSEDELYALGQVLLKYPLIRIISDDVFERLTYGNNHFHNIAAVVPELKDRVMTINEITNHTPNGVIRTGYGGGPKDIVKAIKKVQIDSHNLPPSISVNAAQTALMSRDTIMRDWTDIYQKRGEKLVQKISDIPGITCHLPEGSIFLLVGCQGAMGKTTPNGSTINTDAQFAEYLLKSVGLAVLPGDAFGVSPYIRMAFSLTEEELIDAAKRLEIAIFDLKD